MIEEMVCNECNEKYSNIGMEKKAFDKRRELEELTGINDLPLCEYCCDYTINKYNASSPEEQVNVKNRWAICLEAVRIPYINRRLR